MALSDDAITAMALEANPENDINSMLPFLQRFAALVAAKELEACAQVCDTTYYQFIGPEFGEVRHGIAACAAAIRAKEKP